MKVVAQPFRLLKSFRQPCFDELVIEVTTPQAFDGRLLAQLRPWRPSGVGGIAQVWAAQAATGAQWCKLSAFTSR